MNQLNSIAVSQPSTADGQASYSGLLNVVGVCVTDRPGFIPTIVKQWQRTAGPGNWLLIIDETGTTVPYSTESVSVGHGLGAATPRLRGFKALAALGQLVQNGVAASAAMIFDDTTLLFRPGITDWAVHQLSSYRAALLGAGAESTNFGWFSHQSCTECFVNWGLPYMYHEVGVRPLADGCCFISWEFIKELGLRGLLPPVEWQKWPISWTAALSWTAQMLGRTQIEWGQEDRPKAPLFIDNAVAPRLPSPELLVDGFAVFAPINKVRSLHEQDVLHWADKMGEMYDR